MKIYLGTRTSRLARLQAEEAVAFLRQAFPVLDISIVEFSSPGDRDKTLDLQESPGDFFTRDLDDAVRNGEVDGAVHSAKDLSDPVPEGLDWCWLPRCSDPRDVLITRVGWDGDKPPVMGVSSQRRAHFVRSRFPHAQRQPIRGTIEERLAQLDAGKYDVLVMAGCALKRLGIPDIHQGTNACLPGQCDDSPMSVSPLRGPGENDCGAHTRFYEWIPLAELPTPAGQGYLALTFRKGDRRFEQMRTAWLQPVQFVSAGCGDAEQISLAGRQALADCDLCFYDALLDDRLLGYLGRDAVAVFVGKRAHKHSMEQQKITELIKNAACRGEKVVRLKGGDAGIFGRLAEEIDTLNEARIPYRVHPGISVLSAATTGTGLLLTRRGITDGFNVSTATAIADYGESSRTEVVFMGSRNMADVCADRLASGLPPETPVCLALAVGLDEEELCFGTLGAPPGLPAGNRPGLIVIGKTAAPEFRYPVHGPLGGRRVWLTCSEAMQGRTAPIVRRFGGVPICKPLIRLEPTGAPLPDLGDYDWVILTSPSSVDCLVRHVADLRQLPKLLVCGKGTEAHLNTYRLSPDARPAVRFSTEGVLQTARELIPGDAAILRLRSELAGPRLADALRPYFNRVDDVILYTNTAVEYGQPPPCELVFFASSSAVESLVRQFGADVCRGKICLPLGDMDAQAMDRHGIEPVFVPTRATAAQAFQELANWLICTDTEALGFVGEPIF